jgi:hypothetical protein
MMPDGAIGLLIGYIMGAISGIVAFAMVMGLNNGDDEENDL